MGRGVGVGGGTSPFVVHKGSVSSLGTWTIFIIIPPPLHSLDEGKGEGGRGGGSTVSLDIDAELLAVEYEAGGFVVACNAARLQVASLNVAQLLACRKL
jgi:hypothetical protein